MQHIYIREQVQIHLSCSAMHSMKIWWTVLMTWVYCKHLFKQSPGLFMNDIGFEIQHEIVSKVLAFKQTPDSVGMLNLHLRNINLAGKWINPLTTIPTIMRQQLFSELQKNVQEWAGKTSLSLLPMPQGFLIGGESCSASKNPRTVACPFLFNRQEQEPKMRCMSHCWSMLLSTFLLINEN